MKRLIVFPLFFIFVINSFSQITIGNLRCESMTDPLGVDAVKPKLSWIIQSPGKNVSQISYRIIVADDTSLLKKNIGNIWDSKKTNSKASIQVDYNGKTLLSTKKYFWKVMVWDNKGNISPWSNTATWQMGLLTQQDWKNAKWIGYDVLPDSNIIVPAAHGRGKREWGTRKDILPLLRKDFFVNKAVKSATAFVCGLGQFEFSVNGEKIGDHFLDPGWTQYNKHALYVTFDITKQIKQGVNTTGVWLGNGFYYVPGERYRKITGAFGYPKMICRIVIEHMDGTIDNVISNEAWKTAPSPVIFSSIYGGEDYDANLEQQGWSTSSFNDASWKNAVVTTGPPSLNSQTTEPIRVMRTITPINKNKLANGDYVYDLGQNFSGIVSITANGKKGDTIRVIPAELISDDGSANQRGSGGPYHFTYIIKGEKEEKWEPRFSYYGFRYVQVQGAVTDVKGLHIRNAAVSVGDFTCSNELFNKTYELIKWAIKSNTVSVFTDCPHREKLGWLEQNHLMGSSVQYNYDIASLCRKVMRDMMNAQTENGLIPEISPEFVKFEDPFRDSPEWGSAAIILPWYMYQWYGDKQILNEAYDMMRKYIDYLGTKDSGYILSQGLGDWYDIGPNRPGFSQLTPKGLTATAMYYYDLIIMKQIATVLKRHADIKEYEKLAASVRTAFNEKFFNKTTFQYGTGSQTANAMALFMNLVEPKYKDSVVANLVKDIRQRNNALTAGDIGYRYVLRALEDAGRSEVIFDMNSRDDVPGYGYQLKKGATALTESWQGLPSVSNNHFMLGHLMEWFYAGLSGIKQAPGSIAYKHIEIKPQPVGDISFAKASYHSVYGTIKSEWKIEAGVFTLNVKIPANTTADIYLPGRKPVTVGSGEYTYTVKMK